MSDDKTEEAKALERFCPKCGVYSYGDPRLCANCGAEQNKPPCDCGGEKAGWCDDECKARRAPRSWWCSTCGTDRPIGFSNCPSCKAGSGAGGSKFVTQEAIAAAGFTPFRPTTIVKELNGGCPQSDAAPRPFIENLSSPDVLRVGDVPLRFVRFNDMSGEPHHCHKCGKLIDPQPALHDSELDRWYHESCTPELCGCGLPIDECAERDLSDWRLTDWTKVTLAACANELGDIVQDAGNEVTVPAAALARIIADYERFTDLEDGGAIASIEDCGESGFDVEVGRTRLGKIRVSWSNTEKSATKTADAINHACNEAVTARTRSISAGLAQLRGVIRKIAEQNIGSQGHVSRSYASELLFAALDGQEPGCCGDQPKPTQDGDGNHCETCAKHPLTCGRSLPNGAAEDPCVGWASKVPPPTTETPEDAYQRGVEDGHTEGVSDASENMRVIGMKPGPDADPLAKAREEIKVSPQKKIPTVYGLQCGRAIGHILDHLDAHANPPRCATAGLCGDCSSTWCNYHDRKEDSNKQIDTAHLGPWTTVRACIDCGVLVSGGPTRCLYCADTPGDGICTKCGQQVSKSPLGNQVMS